MKNKIIILLCICILLISISLLTIKPKKDTIKLAEVTHSIFYAPLYVAIENNYFKDENLDIELTLISGADKVATSVISNDVNIGFAGAESTIYVYKEKQDDYLISFAGLTKRDGQFIVGRKKEQLDFNNLKQKEVVVGRKGGMPSLNFLHALDNQNINSKDININYSIDYASLSSAFISGIGDYVNLFEPNATKLEKEGLGYIVGSIGQHSGIMPYTTFFAKKSYIENNKQTINKFRKAINKALNYVKENDSQTIAKTIIKQFNDLSIDDLTKMIDRYKDNDSWLDNTNISEEAFTNLENLLIKYQLIDDYVPYNELIKND